MMKIGMLLLLILATVAAFIFYRQKKKLEKIVEELKRKAELQQVLTSTEADDTDETIIL